MIEDIEDTEITDRISDETWKKFQDWRVQNGGNPSEVMNEAEMTELLRLIAADDEAAARRRIAYENSPEGIAENERIWAFVKSQTDDGDDGGFIN